MTLEIRNNEMTGGYNCFFKMGDKKYYADLSLVMGKINECMIFAVREDGNIEWAELYSRRTPEISIRYLTECIEEFRRDHEMETGEDDKRPRN